MSDRWLAIARMRPEQRGGEDFPAAIGQYRTLCWLDDFRAVNAPRSMNQFLDDYQRPQFSISMPISAFCPSRRILDSALAVHGFCPASKLQHCYRRIYITKPSRRDYEIAETLAVSAKIAGAISASGPLARLVNDRTLAFNSRANIRRPTKCTFGRSRCRAYDF